MLNYNTTHGVFCVTLNYPQITTSLSCATFVGGKAALIWLNGTGPAVGPLFLILKSKLLEENTTFLSFFWRMTASSCTRSCWNGWSLLSTASQNNFRTAVISFR